MKRIKIKDNTLLNGRDITPKCETAELLHLGKYKFAVQFTENIPSIGFQSRSFCRFIEQCDSPIIGFRAEEHICLCCGIASEEIVLLFSTQDGRSYQINSTDELTLMIEVPF